MNEDYITRVIEFSETNRYTYQQVLNDCQSDVIEAFGGLDTMVELCLTNSQFCTNKYKSEFDSFKRLMESKNININNEDNIEHGYDVTITYNTHQKVVSNNDKKNTDVILPNLSEFYKYSFGMMAYYSDSLYFVFLSPTTANYIFDHVLHTCVSSLCYAYYCDICSCCSNILVFFWL